MKNKNKETYCIRSKSYTIKKFFTYKKNIIVFAVVAVSSGSVVEVYTQTGKE